MCDVYTQYIQHNKKEHTDGINITHTVELVPPPRGIKPLHSFIAYHYVRTHDGMYWPGVYVAESLPYPCTCIHMYI